MHDLSLDKLKWLKEIGVEDICSDEVVNLYEIKDDSNQNKNTEYTLQNNLSKEKNMPEEKLTSDSSKPFSLLSTGIDPEILARKVADESDSLEKLHENLLAFDGCELKKFATNTVFGEGVKNPDIVFIGEAPGANEDLQGRPFCGDSGQLFDLMLSHIGISRTSNCYITNSVFWRPPANRKPTETEVEICRPFVEKHISFLKPKLLVCVGSTATASLFRSKETMGSVRGKFKKYKNKYLDHEIECFTVFHPAYLLRQPTQKKVMWFDLLAIEEYLKEK